MITYTHESVKKFASTNPFFNRHLNKVVGQIKSANIEIANIVFIQDVAQQTYVMNVYVKNHGKVISIDLNEKSEKEVDTAA